MLCKSCPNVVKKLFQSFPNVVIKLHEICPKIISKLSLSCPKIVLKLAPKGFSKFPKRCRKVFPMLSPKCLKWCPSYTPTQVELKRYPSSVHVMSTLCPSDVQVVQNVVNSINCPTQPTCIAHFDLCICQLYFITNPQWKYERNKAGQLATPPRYI